jgi:hypothetical protein
MQTDQGRKKQRKAERGMQAYAVRQAGKPEGIQARRGIGRQIEGYAGSTSHILSLRGYDGLQQVMAISNLLPTTTRNSLCWR